MSYSGTKTLYDMIYLNPEQPFTYEWHYSLEKAVAPHSSPLAWKIPWSEEPGRLQSMGSQRVGYDWATSLSLFTFKHWKRKWQPTPVFLPGESQGWGAWWAAIYGVAQSRTWLKRLAASAAALSSFCREEAETQRWSGKGEEAEPAARWGCESMLITDCTAWPAMLVSSHVPSPRPRYLQTCNSQHVPIC